MHFLADQVRIFAKCLREVGGNGVIDGCVEEIGRGCMVFFRFAVQLFPKFCSSNVSSVRNNRQLSNQATTMRCVLIRCFAFDSRRRGGRKGIWSRHEIRAVQVAMQVASVAPTSQGLISKKGSRREFGNWKLRPKLAGKSAAVVAEAHPVTSSRRRD